MVYRRKSDGDMNKLRIFPMLIVCIHRDYEHQMAGLCLGSG